MKRLLPALGFSTLCLSALLPNPARAYDFGFVRAPDAMDPYVAAALAATGLFFGLTMLVKPQGVAFRELRANAGAFSPAGRLIYFAFKASFLVLMVLVFLGMGLQRAAEAGTL